MRERISIRRSRRRTTWEEGGILDLLSKMLIEYDKESRISPPVDFVQAFYRRMPRKRHLDTLYSDLSQANVYSRGILSNEKKMEVGRVFLELCRVRELVDGLGTDCLVLSKDDISVPVTLYLLTGYLRPENEQLLDNFVTSTDFNTVANAVYAIERMPPIERYYYKHLISKNLYSKDAVLRWFQRDEKSSKFANRFLTNVKEEIQKYYGPTSKPWRESSIAQKWTVFRMKSSIHSIRTIIGKNKDNYLKSASISSLKAKKPYFLSISNKQQPSFIEKEQKPFVEEVSEETIFEKKSTWENISSKSTLKGKFKEGLTNYPNNFKSKLLESEESIDLNIEEVHNNEVKNKSNRPKLHVSSRNYRRNEQLVKMRTDFKNDELINEEKHKSFLSFRTNAATLLKEAAIILKEEEEANKKFLDLMVGSPNYLEYEKMIEERIAEEKELFKLKIHKQHLQGKLTEQSAILAKYRLIHESKLRREEFEKEKKNLFDDMAILKESEKVKIMDLVSKVKDIHDRVAIKKKNLKDEKRLEVEKLSYEIKRSLKEAIVKQKRELEEKVLMIKEVRAFEALKKTLQHKRAKATIDSSKLGLLSEMSMEELAERKREMKNIITVEINIRRKQILSEIKEREALIDRAEQFVHEHRIRKRQKKMDNSSPTNVTGVVNPDIIPETFLRAVPPQYKSAINYIGILSEIKEIKNENIKKIKKEKNKCRNNNILHDSFFENAIINKFKNKESLVTYEFNENNLKVRKLKSPQLHSPKVVRSFIKFESSGNLDQPGQQDNLKSRIWFIWKKFKDHMKKKLPKACRKLSMPPKKWMPIELLNTPEEKFKQNDENKANRFIMRKLRKRKSKKHVSTYVKEKVWKRKWREFYYTFLEAEKRMKKYFNLEKINDTYTQSIIKQINYYINARLNVKKKQNVKLNNTIFKSKHELKSLQTQIDLVNKKVIEARQRSTKKSLSKREDINPRKLLVLPNSNNLINEMASVRNITENIVKVPALEAEDNEIKETILQVPITNTIETNKWMTESEYKLTQLKTVERESTESIIHVWELPKKRKGNKIISKPQVSLELKLLTRFGRKYSLLKNQYGNPVFMLRPVKNNPRKWEWYPVVIMSPISRTKFHAAVEIPPELSQELSKNCIELKEKRQSLVQSLILAQKSNRNNLLAKLMAAQVRECDYYLRGLRGAERTEYFKNVPLKMLLEYMESNPLGGLPHNLKYSIK